MPARDPLLSQKGTAYHITPLQPTSDVDADADPPIGKSPLVIPFFHPSTFLSALQARVLPNVKAHYNLDRLRSPLSSCCASSSKQLECNPPRSRHNLHHHHDPGRHQLDAQGRLSNTL